MFVLPHSESVLVSGLLVVVVNGGVALETVYGDKTMIEKEKRVRRQDTTRHRVRRDDCIQVF